MPRRRRPGSRVPRARAIRWRSSSSAGCSRTATACPRIPQRRESCTRPPRTPAWTRPGSASPACRPSLSKTRRQPYIGGGAIHRRRRETMRDPYEVLGVSKKASEAEIKKAFRNLAKKHHPDTKGGDAAAQKKFQEISAAYDIVGDKEKRAKFDAGEIDAGGNPRGFDPGAGGPFGRGGGSPRDFHFTWTDQDAQGAQGAQSFSAEDLFSDLLGGLGGRGGRQQPRPGQDFSVAVTVSFEEAARGGSRRVMLPNGE